MEPVLPSKTTFFIQRPISFGTGEARWSAPGERQTNRGAADQENGVNRGGAEMQRRRQAVQHPNCLARRTSAVTDRRYRERKRAERAASTNLCGEKLYRFFTDFGHFFPLSF